MEPGEEILVVEGKQARFDKGGFIMERDQSPTDVATCPTCSEKMDIPPFGRRLPKLLHCLHTICLPCLEKSWNQNHRVNVVCPLCRTTTSLPKDKGPQGLTNNFSVIRVLELLALQADKVIICEECAEARNSKASHRCVECRLFLCDAHHLAHTMGRRTSGHPILTLDEVKKSEEAKSSIGSRAMCTREGHEGQELTLYCETCDAVICLACTLHDHSRPTHHYDFVNKSVKKHKEEITSLLVQAKQGINKLETTLSAVKETQKRVRRRNSEIQEDLKKAFETLRIELGRREQGLLAELNALVTGKERVLGAQEKDVSFALENLSSACSFSDRMLQSGSDVEVLQVKTQKMKRLAQLNDTPSDTEPKTNERMSFGIDLVSMTSQIAHAGWVRDSTVYAPLCRAEGEGVKNPIPERENKFVVVTCDKDGKQIKDGGEQLTVLLFDEKKENALVKAAEVKDRGDGTYAVSFLPRPGVAGFCSLYVTIRGSNIEDSPFTLDLNIFGRTLAENTTAEGDGVSSCVPGKQSSFTIIARDLKGQPRQTGGDDFAVEIKADTKGDPKIDVIDNGNGTYAVTYSLPEDARGESLISVYFESKDIKGSPFRVSINVTLPDFGDVSALAEWLGKVPSQWRQLYKASKDGWATREFHQRCDNQGATVVLVRLATGHIFGGYTTIPWKTSGGLCPDPDSFLFSLTDGKGRKPFKCPPVIREKGAVIHHAEFGPVWCGGADLSLRLDRQKLGESFSHLKRYKLPDAFKDQAEIFLAGKYSGWEFSEVEIYAV